MLDTFRCVYDSRIRFTSKNSAPFDVFATFDIVANRVKGFDEAHSTARVNPRFISGFPNYCLTEPRHVTHRA